jgi:hypothetical protein
MPAGGVAAVTEPLPGNTEFIAALREAEGKLEVLEPLYALLYESFLRIERHIFDSEGRGTARGGGWRGLSAETVRTRGEAHPIMDRTDSGGGMLKKSLTQVGAQNAVFEPLVDGIEMGTDIPYAWVQHAGDDHTGRSGTTAIPQRRLVAETQVQANLFAGIIRDYLFGLAHPFEADMAAI